jgi:hypothetical protein
MIDAEATKKRFGYSPDGLTPQSHKLVVVKCDNCGMVFGKNGRVMKREVTKRRKRNPEGKDLCNKCFMNYQNPYRDSALCEKILNEKYQEIGRTPTREEIPIG